MSLTEDQRATLAKHLPAGISPDRYARNNGGFEVAMEQFSAAKPAKKKATKKKAKKKASKK